MAIVLLCEGPGRGTRDRKARMLSFASLQWQPAGDFMAMKQKIDELTENEITWVKAQLENAAKFVKDFSPADSVQPFNLAALDRAYAAWIESGPTEVPLINATIHCVGVAFGQSLLDGVGLGFRWVIATDEYGTDLAVYGLPNQADVLVFPATFVAKRWEARETNFLETTYLNMEKDIRELHQSWQRS